jgi:hypothetical protein
LALTKVTGNKIRIKEQGNVGAALKIPTQPNPAFRNRPSMESDLVGRRGCIEHDDSKGLRVGLTEVKVQRFGWIMRSSAGAEKGGEGMALKI